MQNSHTHTHTYHFYEEQKNYCQVNSKSSILKERSGDIKKPKFFLRKIKGNLIFFGCTFSLNHIWHSSVVQSFVFLEHTANESCKEQTRNIVGVHLGKKSPSHSKKWVQYKSVVLPLLVRNFHSVLTSYVILLTVILSGKLKGSGVIFNM